MGPAQAAVEHVQRAAPQIQQLPEWLEYVKALGTPVAAIVAAAITGVIAYRQWRTASSKLKLDLYEKRMEIYKAAVEVARYTVSPLPFKDRQIITDLSQKFPAARWIMDERVAEHLDSLRERAYKNIFKKDKRLVGVAEDERFAAGFKIMEEDKQQLKNEVDNLDRIFANYLTIKH